MPEDGRLAVVPAARSQALTGRPNGRRQAAHRERLGKALVDGLEPQAAEYTVWDADTQRLGLRIMPSGSKVYVVQFRPRTAASAGSRSASTSNPWTAETARREAQRILGLAAAGKDVTLPRERARELPTVKAFAERFMTQYGAAHLKPSSQEGYQFTINNHVLPALGKLRVDRVQRADVEALHLKLRALR